MKIRFSREYIRNNAIQTAVVAIFALAALVTLSYVLLHNPHQNLQRDVLATAERVHNFYREKPGYWQLSTGTAKEDKLLAGSLGKYKEYDVQIGQGLDGESSLPSHQSFNIVLKHLNKSACINLSELPLTDSAGLILQKITLINETEKIEFAWGAEHPLPIAKYSMRSLCQPRENTLVWTFQ